MSVGVPNGKGTTITTVSPDGQGTTITTVSPDGQRTTTTNVSPDGQHTTTTTVSPDGQHTTTTTVSPDGQRTTTTNVSPDGQPKDTSSRSSISNLRLGALASVSAATTVLVALRLISVAKFNPETAYGILQASGTGNVIIGTVISLIPSIAIIVALYLISMRVLFRPKTTPEAEFTRWTFIFMLALIALLTIPLRYVIYAGPGILAFLALIVAVAIRTKKGKSQKGKNQKDKAKRREPASETGETESASETGETEPASETGETDYLQERRWGKWGTAAAISSAFLVAFIVMLGVVASPPWMPAERLTLKDHQKIVGYVLAQTQEGLTFMQAGSMNITQYEPGIVKDQVFCSDAPARDLPIIYYMRSIPGFDLGHYRIDLGHYLSNHLGHYTHC